MPIPNLKHRAAANGWLPSRPRQPGTRTRSQLVMLLRRSGRGNHPALVEQILADVFALPGVSDTNDGYGRTFLGRIPLVQRVS